MFSIKPIRILLVGLGSIGKRHLLNLSLLPESEIHVVTKRDLNAFDFSDNIFFHNDLDVALSFVYDYALICSSTADHIDHLKRIAQSSVARIYCEKPLSHKADQLSNLLFLEKSSKIDIRLGFDLRLDEGLNKVIELLNSDAIGKVINFQASVGQYLPDWRPNTDYKKSYSAKKALGGGVLLDLSHELDFITLLFGKPNLVFGLCKNSGSLEIETEDIASVILRYNSGIIGTLNLDYLQKQLRRTLLIIGSMGEIEWDLARARVRLTSSEESIDILDYSDSIRNDRFKRALEDFLFIDKSRTKLASLSEGIFNIQLIENIKLSSETLMPIGIDNEKNSL